MEKTPRIPCDIKTFYRPAYVNVYSLCSSETRLYGTESLYGDWNGRLLLLAQDFAPCKIIGERMAQGDTRPYHHTDWECYPKEVGWKTNKALYNYSETIKKCGKLYGSALANLLRNDGRRSGRPPALGNPEIKQFISKVLRFTVSQMPNLQVIACLGTVAWNCTAETYNRRDADWNEYRNARKPLKVEHLKIFALAHPSRPYGGRIKVDRDWEYLKINLEA